MAKDEVRMIYGDKQNIVHCLEAYADELRTCEKFITMGYVRCGEIKLGDRIRYLKRRIDEMDKQRKKKKQRR